METLAETSLEDSKTDAPHLAFTNFLVSYQPVLESAEEYLVSMIEKTAPTYAEAYKPWKDALHELLEGAYLISHKIELPDKDEFMNALKMFSFDSTIKFLRDICKICDIELKIDWEINFREHIDKLLFAIANLFREQQAELGW